jgi:hypothetical protein
MSSEWTPEEEEAFNEVEKHSNLGKEILRSQGQPYHWEAEAIKAAVRMEREACAKLEIELILSPAFFATMGEYDAHKDAVLAYRNLIRARGQA